MSQHNICSCLPIPYICVLSSLLIYIYVHYFFHFIVIIFLMCCQFCLSEHFGAHFVCLMLSLFPSILFFFSVPFVRLITDFLGTDMLHLKQSNELHLLLHRRRRRSHNCRRTLRFVKVINVNICRYYNARDLSLSVFVRLCEYKYQYTYFYGRHKNI